MDFEQKYQKDPGMNRVKPLRLRIYDLANVFWVSHIVLQLPRVVFEVRSTLSIFPAGWLE